MASIQPDPGAAFRRRPTLFSLLSFRSGTPDAREPDSPLYSGSGSGGLLDKGAMAHPKGASVSIMQAARSRLGKAVLAGLVLLGVLVFLLTGAAPSQPPSGGLSEVGSEKPVAAIEAPPAAAAEIASVVTTTAAPVVVEPTPTPVSEIAAVAPVTTEIEDVVSGTDNEAGSIGSCTKSHDGLKPVTQYVLMIDAGSTGSRIHVYEFSNCNSSPELVREVFEMTRPGLSSYPDEPVGAAKSLDSLLAVAMKEVPEELKGCTPVAVKATAGLRILGDEKSETILKAVRAHLEEDYPFPVVAGDGISIMDGKDEGVYAWITTNFLLGNIGSAEDLPTAAVFDLGGGSTQIVFEPTFPVSAAGVPEQMTSGDHKYDLQFGGRHFTLYQHSHLGYGLMEARKKVHAAVLKSTLEMNPEQKNPSTIVSPCLPPNMRREVEIVLDDKTYVVNMTGPSEPSAVQCRFLTEQILMKDEECAVPPCSFNGVHQPSLSRTFSREDIYIFSYFYDRTYPLGMPHSFSLAELRELTAKVCKGTPGWDSFASIPGAIDELSDRPEWCLDLNFMTSILHMGYDIPLEREVKIAKKLKGNELGWCLGASLPLLDQGSSGWQCKLSEISLKEVAKEESSEEPKN
ncbi:nucleoside phosphatase family-domain-containing protein [Limtongia smithiae]|uniref:nucleoside phosphatase family-domain-containing protein n=1 Tax=Limtongia smithiae TaxID=1125753 RepID=UPI0034CF1F18